MHVIVIFEDHSSDKLSIPLDKEKLELNEENLVPLKKYLQQNPGKFKVKIPEGITSIGYSAFYGCTSLRTVTLPGSIKIIGNSAFDNCFSLETVNIPEGATSIGESAFACCFSLETVNIPDNITIISNWAFYSCTSLKTVTLPEGTTIIGNSAFARCTSLTKVNIPDNVTIIGDSAFADCSSLTTVNIPDNVTSIGQRAFAHCSSLEKIIVSDPNKAIFEMTYNYESEQWENGKTLLEFAVETKNYTLAVNTLLEHRDNIQYKSLPESFKAFFTDPTPGAEDIIDSNKVLKHLLDDENILPNLIASKSYQVIDKLSQHFFEQNKVSQLKALIVENNQLSENHRHRKDLSLLEETIDLRYSQVHRNDILSMIPSKEQRSFTPLIAYLSTQDLRALICTSKADQNPAFKSSSKKNNSSL